MALSMSTRARLRGFLITSLLPSAICRYRSRMLTSLEQSKRGRSVIGRDLTACQAPNVKWRRQRSESLTPERSSGQWRRFRCGAISVTKKTSGLEPMMRASSVVPDRAAPRMMIGRDKLFPIVANMVNVEPVNEFLRWSTSSGQLWMPTSFNATLSRWRK
jgi:hypothetical protein